MRVPLDLRLAGRELRRRPLRFALVALLVAVPCTATLVALTWVSHLGVPAAERHAEVHGTVDLVLYADRYHTLTLPREVPVDELTPLLDADARFTPVVDELLTDVLPDESRWLTERTVRERVRLDDVAAAFVLTDLPLDHPLTRDRFTGLSGRLPTSAGEVVLTEPLAQTLGVAIGDTVRPQVTDEEMTVVGTVRYRSPYGTRAAHVAPGTLDDEPARAETMLIDVAGVDDRDSRWAMRTAVDAELADTFTEARDRTPDGDSDRMVGPPTEAADPPARDRTDTFEVDGIPIEPPDDLIMGPAIELSRAGLLELDAARWTTWGWDEGAAGPRAAVSVAGALLLAVTGVLVAAAFAVSARAQLHRIGLLAAAGAPPRRLVRILVTQGAAAAFLGAVLAVLATNGLLRAIGDARWSSAVDRAITVPWTTPLDVAVVTLLAVACGVGAAAVPALRAARLPVLTALAGRVPTHPVQARVPVVGWLLVGSGAALAALAVVWRTSGNIGATVGVLGGVAVLAGICVLSPWVVSLMARLVGRRSATAHLAARGLERSRVRASATVASICVTATVVVALSTTLATTGGWRAIDAYVPETPPGTVLISSLGPAGAVDADQLAEVAADVAAAVGPDAEATRVDTVAEVSAVHADAPPVVPDPESSDPGEPPPQASGLLPSPVGVATEDTLDVLDLPAHVRQSIADGHAVALAHPSGGYVPGLPLPFDVDEADATVTLVDRDGDPIALSVTVVTSDRVAWRLPAMWVSPSVAERLDGVPSSMWVVDTPDGLSAAQAGAVELLADDLRWQADADNGLGALIGQPSTAIEISVGPHDSGWTEVQVRAAVLGGAVALMVAVMALSLALAGRDGREERVVLAAVGAGPRRLRAMSVTAAALTVGGAALVALPAGLAPVAAVAAASNVGLGELRVDWPTILALVVGAPLAAAAVTWAATSLRDRVRPVPVDPALVVD
ncbi:MAG: hypothetical protein JJU45_05440 [Acidimicrobiia bacterium]|nr:hypothetical protein [Acidimicrobiia bacterium]